MEKSRVIKDKFEFSEVQIKDFYIQSYKVHANDESQITIIEEGMDDYLSQIDF
jgi:hypothetical protein